MKANVYSLEGKKVGEVELPKVFEEEVRPDLIKRAVIAAQSHRYQAHGVDVMAGKRTSAYSFGPGHGLSRSPRVKGHGHPTAGRVAFVPIAVGGRQTFPPLVEKRIREKINLKERKKAVASALAATAKKELVEARGHAIEKVLEIPLIVSNDFEALKTAKEVREAFAKLGVWEDVIRAKLRKERAGIGKLRGRRFKRKKSVLIVVGEDKGIMRAAGNHPGVDVALAKSVGVEHLAPGTHYGRLTIYTQAALQKLEERFKL